MVTINHDNQPSYYYSLFNLNIDIIQRTDNIRTLKASLSFLSFGNKVNYLLNESGLSKSVIAKKMRTTEKTLSNWCNDFNNEINLTPLMLLKFAVALNLPPEISKLLTTDKQTDFKDNQAGDIYRQIRTYHYCDDIVTTINDILEAANLKPW